MPDSSLFQELRAPIAISLGAIGGALCRYYLTRWSLTQWGNGFPYGTLLINLSGCAIMGLVNGLGPKPSPLQLLATTGFLGAYTTFSTYGLETVQLFQRGAIGLAGSYWLGSAGLGLLFVVLGQGLGAAIRQGLGR
ncbi:MAG: hypothetical protein RLZZ511_9 [Cyanobacteriota bacterium]